MQVSNQCNAGTFKAGIFKTISATAVLVCGLGAGLLSGCASTVEPAHYADQKPALVLSDYFNGTLDASGMFQDRAGTVIKRFTVVMRCHWQGDVGTLDEDFSYSDGTRQKRVWTLRQTGDGQFTGTAPDVVGEAIGTVAGNALRWKYVLALPVGDTVYNVHFDDWMFLMEDGVMLNRARMSKFGFDLGQVTLSFRKRSSP